MLLKKKAVAFKLINLKSDFLILIFSFYLLPASLYSQRTAIYADPDHAYKSGMELFDKKQYTAAQKHFDDCVAGTKSSELKSDAIFYSAACGIELFNKDGEWKMKYFLQKYPAATKESSAYFYLAKSSFRKHKFPETIENFNHVDEYQLNREQLSELRFKRGYSYLSLPNPDDEKAKTDLFAIKDVDNKYAFPANYYYSHLMYKEKNYEMALQGFNRLTGNETFGSVVPYYITQIYFMQGKYDKVTVEAPKLLRDSANIQREGEINRMIGESFFNLENYSDALHYLSKTDLGMSAEGNYVLGYCYYKTNDNTNAINTFIKATEKTDSLAQNAWYHIADCYVKTNEKLKAKNAFYNAYQTVFDKKITEDALFSFAKLSYELDFSPYNEAVKSLQKYLNEYSDSPRKKECYTILTNVYSTTKNYEQAIASIENIGNIDPILKATYQKLIYFKAVENFNNSDLDNAEKQFKKSLTQNADQKLNALSQYWLGEIYFLRKDYSTAIDAWKKFQITEGATQLQEYDLSNYALGYAFFQRKEKDDYGNANISFRKFLLSKNEYNENKITDANIRTADSYFMTRDFLQASEYYNKAIDKNKIDVDYSLYQKALCDGLSKHYEEKIKELQRIENEFKNSNYLSSALSEIAETFHNNLKDYDNAIIYYQKILDNYPNSSFANNCLAQVGNIFYERKQDDKAFEFYDQFVKTNPQSDAAKDILEAIKKIFETKGDVDGMEKYFASIGNPLSENQIEKSLYSAAYDAFYNQKNCDVAMGKWESYISKFPNGKYLTEAEFNFAECAYSKSMFTQAANAYSVVIQKPRGIYSETALSKITFLLMKDKNYSAALPLFQHLQEYAETPANKSAAKFGAMRCAFNLNDFESALSECNKVLAIEKITPQQNTEAKYVKAKSLYETKRLDDALAEFRAMTKTSKNLAGAEAYYYVAKILFEKQEYKEVEKAITKLISYEYSNDDWNNKGMLLLADSYMAKGDDADAEVILNTILEGKPKQEYMDDATMKLQKLNAKKVEKEKGELQNLKKMTPIEMKVEFKQSLKDTTMFDKIREDEEIEPIFVSTRLELQNK